MAFAFSDISIPHPQHCALRFNCLKFQAGIRGFHVPHN
jgi:hypothetical protein